MAIWLLYNSLVHSGLRQAGPFMALNDDAIRDVQWPAAPNCIWHSCSSPLCPRHCSMMFLLISGILLWNVTCIPKIFPMVILVKILINRCINSGRMCLMKCTNEYSKCTNEPFVKRHLVSDFMWFVMWKAVLFGPGSNTQYVGQKHLLRNTNTNTNINKHDFQNRRLYL